MCIIYSYFSSSVRDNMNRKRGSALRCEIITDQPEALSQAIIQRLHHSVTALEGKGMYTGEQKSVLVCIINTSQLTELSRLVEEFPGSFVTFSHVNAVLGNFKQLDSKSNPEKQYFDSGKK